MRESCNTDPPGQAHRGRPPPWPTIVGFAVLVGLGAGALFAVRETVRVSVGGPARVPAESLSDLLSLGAYAVVWYAGIGAVVMAVVGGCAALLVRTGRVHWRMAELTGVYVAVAAFFFLWGALGFLLKVHKHGPTVLSQPYAALESGLVSACCALGLGCVANWLHRTVLGTRGLVALGVALTAALFLAVPWGLWANLVVFPGRATFAVRDLLASGAVIGVAAAFGGALYALLSSLLHGSGPGRKTRCARRAVLMVLLGAAFAPLTILLRTLRRSRPAPAAPGASRLGGAIGAPKRTPNILWIVMDAVRADALSCYGNPRQTTPNLDALAAEGALYERVLAASSWTLPSHASMFTGLLPSRHGCMSGHPHLASRHVTIAELLSHCGYRTLLYANNGYLGRAFHVAQGMGKQRVATYGFLPKHALLVAAAQQRLRMLDYGAADTNRTVRRWTAQCVRASEPFFLFINYMEAHMAYGSTPYYAHWFHDRPSLRKALAVSQDLGAYAAGTAKTSPEEFALLRTLYDGDVTYLDHYIGQLLDHLRRLGILDDTLVIVTSDHGEEFGEHGLIDHAFGLYNTLLRVPLIIRYPEKFGRGMRHERLVGLLDVFPTILDVLELQWEARDRLAGRSLLAGDAREPRWLVAEKDLPLPWLEGTLEDYRNWQGIPLLRRLKSIQSDRLKYVWASDGSEEIYDLRTDPREAHNRIDAMPHEAKRLRGMLESRVGALRPEAYRQG